jgi:predicted enzyme related to lactoylglutathione lyase
MRSGRRLPGQASWSVAGWQAAPHSAAPVPVRGAVSGTGFIDHIGIGVPDLAAAKRYYDELTGLQHLSFMVSSRATVREAHGWAAAHNAEIVHESREFPEYGEHYATYFLDPHGIMLEIVCHSAGQVLQPTHRLTPRFGERCRKGNCRSVALHAA